MARISEIEGIGPAYGEKLSAAGINTTDKLLKKGAKPSGRKAIAKETGISEQKILQWVNHADLFRIKGIGPEYAELLEVSGVNTVLQLARRNPENLLDKMAATNAKKKLVRKLPTASQVASWVNQAKDMPRVIEY